MTDRFQLKEVGVFTRVVDRDKGEVFVHDTASKDLVLAVKLDDGCEEVPVDD